MSNSTQKKNRCRKNQLQGWKNVGQASEQCWARLKKKKIENLRNRIDVKLVSNEKNLLEKDIKINLHATKNI